MLEQTYKIRHNEDGTIVSQDVRDIVDLALENLILQGAKNDYIFVYREASETNPEQYPEGWYKDDYEMVIQEIMRSDEGFNCILNALSEYYIVMSDMQQLNVLIVLIQNVKILFVLTMKVIFIRIVLFVAVKWIKIRLRRNKLWLNILRE